MNKVPMPVSRCKIPPFLVVITMCRTVKVGIVTRIGLVKETDKVILHCWFVLHIETRLTVHDFKVIV